MRSRFGVVLGAGGAFGWAFHLGVLQGMAEATGRDLGDADRVIGTSAGAAIGAATLTGGTVESILETATAGPDETTRAQLPELMKEMKNPLRWLRPQAPRLLLRPGVRHVSVAVVGALPEGVFPSSVLRRFVPGDEVDWPASLWITSVGLHDGKRVVFGRGGHDVALHDALEASGTVPSLMQPKHIDGRRFVDGAVHSATNTDLLYGDMFDQVVISSPMTRPGRGPVKIRARRHLATEMATLGAAGTEVVTIEPDEKIMEIAEGFPRTNPDAGIRIVEAARTKAIAAFDR